MLTAAVWSDKTKQSGRYAENRQDCEERVDHGDQFALQAADVQLHAEHFACGLHEQQYRRDQRDSKHFPKLFTILLDIHSHML